MKMAMICARAPRQAIGTIAAWKGHTEYPVVCWRQAERSEYAVNSMHRLAFLLREALGASIARFLSELSTTYDCPNGTPASTQTSILSKEHFGGKEFKRCNASSKRPDMAASRNTVTACASDSTPLSRSNSEAAELKPRIFRKCATILRVSVGSINDSTRPASQPTLPRFAKRHGLCLLY